MKKVILGVALSCIAFTSLASQVNVYSGRQEALIKPVLDAFEEETGIKVNLVTGKADALIQRAKSEGEFSPVDVLVMADAGRLARAKAMGLTQPFSFDKSVLPEGYFDTEEHWVALTKRARTVMVKSDDEGIKPSSIYELANPEYKGEICVRSSSNIYNQSMVAAMILTHGEEKTLEWAKGIAENMARSPRGGDRDQLKGVIAGECRFAISNTYYLGGMMVSTDESQRAIAEQLDVLWSPESAGGTHVNISGAAVAKYASNKENAEKLVAFMLNAEQQNWYAEVNQEYPVIDDVEWSQILADFGTFDEQKVDFNKMGDLNDEALKLMDKAGWK